MIRGFPHTTGKTSGREGALVQHSLTYHMSVVRLMRRGFPQTTGKPVDGSGAPVHPPLAYHMSVGRLLSQTMLRGDATNKDFGIHYQMSRPRSVLKRP